MADQFQQLIPFNITKLDSYAVSMELFVCTAIVLGVFLLMSLALLVFWVIRSKGGYFNPEYEVDFAIKRVVHENLVGGDVENVPPFLLRSNTRKTAVSSPAWKAGRLSSCA